MKDPAVLWYFNDWGGGTVGMTRHQKGAYMDLLHAQFNLGDLSLVQIKNVLGVDFGPHWSTIQKKFTFDLVTELYYNERLKQEREKRSKFTDSRRSNRLSKSLVSTTEGHMEDVNENRNVINIKKEYGEFKKVTLSDEEYAKLVERFGEPNTQILIGELDTGIASKGYKYRSHYATILNWTRRKIQQHVESNKPKRTIA